jgi:WD40 repeat protein
MVENAHPGLVTAVVFDPTGETIISASVDGAVNVWDVGTGGLRARWPAHTGPVNALAIDRYQGHLLTAGHDRTVAVWRLADGRPVRRLTGLGGGALDAVAVGHRVAAACFDGTIALWDGAGGPHTLDGHTDAVTTLCPLGDDLLVSGARDRTVRIWDLSSGQVRTLTGHGFWITRVRPAGRGDVVTVGEDGLVGRWAASGTAPAWTLDVGLPIWGLGCDRVGRRAVAGAAGATWLVDLLTGTGERLDDLGSATCRAIAVAPDDRTLALGDDTGGLLLYDLDQHEVLATLHPRGPRYLSLALSAPDRGIVGRSDGGVELVSPASRSVVDDAHATFVYAARRLDHDRFATGGFDGVARVWNLATAERARIEHGKLVFSLSTPAAADRLLVAGGDARTVLWDLDTIRETWSGDAEGTGVHWFAAIDGRGQRVALVGEDDLLHLWWPGPDDVVTWTLPDDAGCGVEWVPTPGDAPERSVVVATAYGRVHLVDVDTGDHRTLHSDHEDWIRQLRVSPDGRYVASTSQNGVGRVFDLRHGRLVAQGELVDRVVAALDITPDGDIVAVDPAGDLARVDPAR